jgi:hypothetical protein
VSARERVLADLFPAQETTSAKIAAMNDDRIVRAGAARFVQVGEALKRIHDAKGYQELGFSSFEAYVKDVNGKGRRWAYYLMASVESVNDRAQSGLPAPANEWQARGQPKTVKVCAFKGCGTEAVRCPDTGQPFRYCEAHMAVVREANGRIHEARRAATTAPIQGEIVVGASPFDAEYVAPAWQAAGSVKTLLDLVHACNAGITEVLDNPEALAQFDITACQLGAMALSTTSAKSRELIRILKTRQRDPVVGRRSAQASLRSDPLTAAFLAAMAGPSEAVPMVPDEAILS